MKKIFILNRDFFSSKIKMTQDIKKSTYLYLKTSFIKLWYRQQKYLFNILI